MQRVFYILLFWLVFVQYTKAQLNFPAAPGEDCSGAPVLCSYNDLHGYMSEGLPIPNPIAPPDFCATSFDNVQWLGFVAHSNFLQLEIEVSNCLGSLSPPIGGIQVGIYGADDCCEGFFPVSNCYSTGNPSTTVILSTNINLVQGDVYYLIIDGFAFDVCMWEVSIVSFNNLPPLDNPVDVSINGPTIVSGGNTTTYTLDIDTDNNDNDLNDPDCEYDLVGSCGGACWIGDAIVSWTVPPGATIVNQSNSSPYFIDVEWGDNPGGEVCALVEWEDCETADDIEVCLTIENTASYCENAFLLCGENLDGYSGKLDTNFTSYQAEGGSGVFEYQWLGSNVQNQALLEVYQPGNYYFVVTDLLTGCLDTAFVNVFEDFSPPIVDIIPPEEITCFQSSSVLDATGSSNGSDFSYAWYDENNNFIGNSPQQDVNSGGGYSLVVTNISNGCSAEAETIVPTDLQSPDINTSSDGVLNCDISSVELSASSSMPVFEYVWTSPSGEIYNQQNPNVSEPGLYEIKITADNGCTTISSAWVEADTIIPALSMFADGVLNCNNNDVEIQVTSNNPDVAFTWNTAPGNIFVNGQGESAVVTAPGVFEVVAQAPNGCTNNASISIDGDYALPGVTASDGIINCIQPIFNLSAISDDPYAEFNWSGPNGFSAPGPFAPTDTEGAYEIMVTGQNGCTASTEVEVIADTLLPEFSISSGTIICADTSVQIIAESNQPDINYQWTGPAGNTFTGKTIEASLPGEYILEGKAPNGCTNVATILVEENYSPPQLEAVGGLINCAQTVFNLSATSDDPDAQFSWSGPNGFSAFGPTAPTSVGGVYEVIVTGQNGCTASTEVEVLVDTLSPEISISSGVITCADTSVQIIAEGNLPGIEYQWTGPEGNIFNGSVIDVSLPGAYLLEATAPNGCSSTLTTVVIADLSAPQLVISSEKITCSEPFVEISMSSNLPVSSVNWIGPDNFESEEMSPEVNAAGSYEVWVISSNGCTSTAQFSVEIDTITPVLNAFSGVIDCVNPTTQVLATSNQPNVAFFWTTPDNIPLVGNVVDVSIPGWYQLEGVAPNGCAGSLNVFVEGDLNAPDFTPVGGVIDCNNNSVNLDINSTEPIASVLWKTPDGVIISQPSPEVSLPGAYSVEVTGENGCTSIDTAFVDLDQNAPNLSVFGTGNLDCNITSVQLIASSTTSNVIFEWNGPNGFVFEGNATWVDTVGTYDVVATAPNGCINEASLIVTGNYELPEMTIESEDLNCNQQPVEIIASSNNSSGLSFLWTGPGGFSSTSPNPEVNQTGLFELMVTGLNGCKSYDSVEINLLPPVEPIMSFIPPSCVGESDGVIIVDTVLGGRPPYEAVFNNFNYENKRDFGPLPAGTYPLEIIDKDGCKWTDPVVLQDPEPFTMSIGDNRIIDLGDEVEVRLQSNYKVDKIRWFKGEELLEEDLFELILNPVKPFVLSVSAENEYGCVSGTSIEITFTQKNLVYVPNAFSPNNDGNNDFFTVYSGEGVKEIKSLRIYDRWGGLLFERQNFLPNLEHLGWNGMFKNDFVQEGVYVYLAIVELVDGELRELSGDVTVKR